MYNNLKETCELSCQCGGTMELWIQNTNTEDEIQWLECKECGATMPDPMVSERGETRGAAELLAYIKERFK